MHPSVAETICGDHVQAFLRAGLSIVRFSELATPKRHAIAFEFSTTKALTKLHRIVEQVNQLGDALSINCLTSNSRKPSISILQKIRDAQLWKPIAYRTLNRIIQDQDGLKALRHSGLVTETALRRLAILPPLLRNTTMVNACETDADASLAQELFYATLRVIPAEARQGVIASLATSKTIAEFSSRCRSQVYKNAQTTLELPLATTYFSRIRTHSDCRRVAQWGHCFNHDFMIEEVLRGELAFFIWHRVKNAVVELQRDPFPFGWSVGNAMKPKCIPLTKLQTNQLAIDLLELGADVRLSSPSSRFEKLLSRC